MPNLPGFTHRNPLSLGDEHPQYLRKAQYFNQLQVFVPAALFGAVPDTGGDMTAAIQSALSSVDENMTLFFQPGTYNISAGVVHDRRVHLWAYGAVFHTQNSVLVSPAYTFGTTVGQLQYASVRGLTIMRNYTFSLNPLGSGGTGIAYTGFFCFAPDRCLLEDVKVEGFDKGFYLVGDVPQDNGCQQNRFHRCQPLNCRYPLTLESTIGATGWVNENSFYDWDLHHTSGFLSAELTDPGFGVEQHRILHNGTNVPNNNHFYNFNYEGASTAIPLHGGPAYRKIRCQGQANHWHYCRYEGHHTTDITIGKAGVAGAPYTANVFYHGYGLDDVIENDRVEYASLPVGINQRNQFFTRWGSIWVGGDGSSNKPAISLYSGNSDSPLFELRRPNSTSVRSIMMRAATSVGIHGIAGLHGPIEFYDDTTNLRNWIALVTAALDGAWDIRVNDGLRISDKFRFYPNGNDVFGHPVTNGINRLVLTGGTAAVEPFAILNADSDGPSMAMYDASSNLLLLLVAHPPGGGELAGLQFYAASATERNRLSMHSTSPYELMVRNGLILNRAATTIPALRLTPAAGDPGTLTDGDLWYNSTTGTFRKRQGGVTTDLDTGGGGAGDAIFVEGVGVIDANFNQLVPAAPPQAAAIIFQKDALSPANISAYLDGSIILNNAARVLARKDSGGDLGPWPRLNFLSGNGTETTLTSDAIQAEFEITVSAKWSRDFMLMGA